MIPIVRLQGMNAPERQRILGRAHSQFDAIRPQVQAIIDDVRQRGDEALVDYTRRWDDPEFSRDKLRITEADIEEAYRLTAPETLERIRDQISLSRRFHQQQRAAIRDWEMEIDPGILAGERWLPMEQVGLYVPGGKNPFPTVQQILAVAAKEAGCPRIVACVSPRGRIAEVLVAAHETGISELYRVSGPHAVAAMAYGTETIAPVDLVAGPGNTYVATAKLLCQERIAIDMLAGPSEAIVLADASCIEGMSLDDKARYCAADLLARAEHGPDSAAVMVTDSSELAEKTAQELQKQVQRLDRLDYIRDALAAYSAIVVTDDMEEALDFTNEYAPEHLEVLTEDPRATLEQIRHAGSVFLGWFNPVALGDYASGVNHILPTGRWARQSSAVGVWTFMKRVQFSEVSRQGIARLQPIVDTLADVEGLSAHRRSVDLRLE